MEARVGDRLVIEGRHVGVGRRSGEVMEVLGQPGHVHYRVRWSDGHESVMFPGGDCVVNRGGRAGGHSESARPAALRVTEVRLRLEEDETHTDARAELLTSIGTFTGWGRARRNPIDANVPLIGEELAAARALVDLADHLRDAAGEAIQAGAEKPGRDLHLVG